VAQSLEQRLTDEIKTAMLAGDSTKVTTLRGLKSAILNVKVADGSRDSEMSDDQVIQIFAKEAKKRQESADLYVQGGNQAKADAELTEKALIETYLPAQLSLEDITKLVDEAIATTGASAPSDMGKVIGFVKGKAGATADGSVIAKLAKERLSA
jgi:uncharacterized protein YqeY